ncbi:nucleotidyltransferase domain-containing protein [Methylomonas rivi]|uniref:Nucleotidyltransferase family protein n=1 Tax=Methylomonas rivi TaxID=2952226 RepID=A0ABT1U0U8_9GAMM|nr:nucleotidyltransferase family protein [Methylomonas sp. WSC-6]MCQ8127188.1 nucleotidyltransferase family protein [Methylomonas sp. WSC-6]
MVCSLNTSLLLDVIQFPGNLRNLPLDSWDKLLRLARASNLIGRIAESVHDQNMLAFLPSKVRPHIIAARILSLHQRQAIQWEIRHLDDALRKLDIPKVLLKGAAYTINDLDAARGRLYGDVDLLVPRSHLAKAEAALMLKGWSVGNIDAYDQRYYRQWMHEIPPMIHCQRGSALDLHHNILPLTALNSPNIDLFFQNAIPSRVSGFAVLAHEDMVLHSAIHFFYESELRNGLRDLIDLNFLINQFLKEDQNFWTLLAERAYITGLSWPLLLAMSMLIDMLEMKVPENVYDNVKKAAKLDVLSRVLLPKIYLQALQSSHPLDNNFISAMSRFAIYIRGHYLRMPVKLLFPHLARKAVGRLIKANNRKK